MNEQGRNVVGFAVGKAERNESRIPHPKIRKLLWAKLPKNLRVFCP